VLYDPLNEVRQHGANTRLVRYRVEITTACDQKGRRRQRGHVMRVKCEILYEARLSKHLAYIVTPKRERTFMENLAENGMRSNKIILIPRLAVARIARVHRKKSALGLISRINHADGRCIPRLIEECTMIGVFIRDREIRSCRLMRLTPANHAN